MKTFTVKEADRLIPKLKGTFDGIFVLKKKIAIMKGELDWLREFWGSALRDGDNPDSERYDKLADAVGDSYGEIKRKISGIEKHGCVVKDADSGLVDFYSLINDELVFLCWRYGEKRIQYWHSVGDGFRGRRPISTIDKIE